MAEKKARTRPTGTVITDPPAAEDVTPLPVRGEPVHDVILDEVPQLRDPSPSGNSTPTTPVDGAVVEAVMTKAMEMAEARARDESALAEPEPDEEDESIIFVRTGWLRCVIA